MKPTRKFPSLFRRCAVHAFPCAASLILACANTSFGAAGDGKVSLRKIADGFVSPLGLLSLDPAKGTLVVVDQVGVAYVLTKDGKKKPEPFLDARPLLTKLNQGFDERGLLCVALHPKFAGNRKVYVYYSAPLRSGAPEGWNHTSHLSEFKVHEDNREKIDPASERVLLRVDQPHFNHDSGRLLFNDEGLLYVSFGDGGAGNGVGKGHVPMGNSQDKSQLLGKILRIDVDGGDPYGIPADNPFVGKEGKDEIFALGMRNPWGMRIHPQNRDKLIIADVGQTRYAEINVVGKGDNCGWNVREGFDGFDPRNPLAKQVKRDTKDAAGKPFTDPVFTYKNANGFPKDPKAYGISICGGYVYRGKALPGLTGKYVFGDWARAWGTGGGTLLVASMEGDRWPVKPLPLETSAEGRIKGYLLAFGEDADGELYLLTNGQPALNGATGAVWKMGD